jgi:hypothetical protein
MELDDIFFNIEENNTKCKDDEVSEKGEKK